MAARGGWGTDICAEHFFYNENNLTNCSTQRNSPPLLQSPPPLLLLHHHHYITISKPRVQSKSSLSRMGARYRGGGEDKTEAVGVDPRQSSLLSPFVYVCACLCVYMFKEDILCMCWCQHKLMFVSDEILHKVCGDTIGLLTGSPQTTMKICHFTLLR